MQRDSVPIVQPNLTVGNRAGLLYGNLIFVCICCLTRMETVSFLRNV